MRVHCLKIKPSSICAWWNSLLFVCRYLIKFLAKLSEMSDINKMSPSNIAIVIGPNLIWPPGDGGWGLCSPCCPPFLLHLWEILYVTCLLSAPVCWQLALRVALWKLWSQMLTGFSQEVSSILPQNLLAAAFANSAKPSPGWAISTLTLTVLSVFKLLLIVIYWVNVLVINLSLDVPAGYRDGLLQHTPVCT